MATIGVFDSGVGGLTVLKELALTFPSENFIYLGDTARLPYGTKSPDTIRKYSEQIMDFLISKKVDAIVIACNTASSQVPEKEWQGVPVFNVIDPGAELAVQTTENGRIGILGTRATIASGSYAKKIKSLAPETLVFSQACPLFVPLAEEGWTDDPITNLIAFRYLQPLLHIQSEAQIDTLILGCTHYPLLKTAIQKACGSSVQLVDSGEAMCEKLSDAFSKNILKKNVQKDNQKDSPEKKQADIQLLTTDLSAHTQLLAEQILSPVPIDHFEVVHL